MASPGPSLSGILLIAALATAGGGAALAANLELDAALETLEDSVDPQVRLRAVLKAGAFADPKSAPALVEALKPIREDPRDDWFVRRAAAAALLRIGKPSVEPLRQVAFHPIDAVRLEALRVLALLDAEGIGKVLAERLERDPSVEVRSECALRLAAIGGDAARAALSAAATGDRSPRVRERAALLLERGLAGPGDGARVHP